ncbi:MFS general substrate transporter [Xylariaceae sp. FL0016]|nr:MFS general substrate transporter [Xylariaceae sp. FL0016]
MDEGSTKTDPETQSDGASRVGPGVVQTRESPATTAEAALASPSPHPATAIPDGGLAAWLNLLGAFIIMINTFGILNTFGVYQTYYETQLLSDHSSSEISWIGSLQGALLMMTGIVSGPLFDAGYFHYLKASGLFLIIFGMFMTSLCSTYWQVLLAQGLCVGLGTGLAFLPSAAILAQYFAKRRALAIGMQSVGSPLTGIIFPIIFQRLQPSIGFGWATRVLAFILLGLAPIPLVFMRPRIPPPKRKRAFLDKSALRDPAYLVLGVGFLFAFLGIYVPFFYIQLYAIRYNIASASFSAYLVTLLNTGSVFGRVLPNIVADRFGSMYMLIASTFGASVLIFGWFGVDNLAGLIVFALLFGFFNGGVTSLPQSAITSLTPDMSRLGTRMGMMFVLVGFAILFGNPIAGAILKDSSDTTRWDGLIGFAAITMFIGSALCGLSQLLHLRDQKRRKAAGKAELRGDNWGSVTHE